MNNQNVKGEQTITELQNIAYVKQFMRKVSVKVMMVVSFLKAILAFVVPIVMSAILMNMINSYLKKSGNAVNIPEMGTINIIIYGIALVINLIFPICLLFIVLKAHNSENTVIARAPVKVIQVLSTIQFIFAIIASVISVAMGIIGLASANSVLESIPSGVESSVGSNFLTSNIIVSLIETIIFYLIVCLYYFFQTRFIKSVYISTSGYSMMYDGAKVYGIFSTILSVLYGIFFAIMVILTVVIGSFVSSSEFMSNENPFYSFLISNFGREICESIVSILIFFTVMIGIELVYQIAVAVTAFGYHSTIFTAIRASYETSSTASSSGSNGRTAFRTYGGGTVQSYDYNSNSSQQAYQSVTNDTPPVQPMQQPVQVAQSMQQPIQTAQPVQQSTQQPVQYMQQQNLGSGSFTPDPNYTQQKPYDNNINFGSGSFGSGSVNLNKTDDM